MIAIDTNILLYAHRGETVEHASALAALMNLASSGEKWGLPWPAVHEFLGIATHPRVYSRPSTIDEALKAIEAWLASPTCRLFGEETGHWEELKKVIHDSKVVGPLIHDARIAALCLHHGVRELWTCDRDFSRFPRLKTRNPVVRKSAPYSSA